MVLGYASFMRGLDRLLELQELDTAIDRLEARKRRLEEGKEIAEARAAMEDAEGRLGELRLGVDAVVREQQRLEREIDSMTRKAEVDEKRLYDGSIANVKEMEALQHEITSLKERRSRSEDDLLEQMVRRDDLESRAGEASTVVQQARVRLEAVGGEAVVELERIEAELAEKRAAREKLVPEFDDELLELYEELRRQKRGVAVAALVDGVCQACHEKLSAMELDRLKRTEGVKRCEYCRRIVVFA
jgi:predicted  nucleic acid-binding Zn-ribbon protein